MEVNLDQVESFEKLYEEVIDLELEVKIEKSDGEIIKTEVFEEKHNFEPCQFIGDKRKSKELSDSENKKIKEELLKEVVVFEELDGQQEPEETNKIDRVDFNTQVLLIYCM
jgi:hypothetical protein